MTASAAAEFTSLTTPHLPRLFKIGMRLTHQQSESDDLVQETLTRAWANWTRYERGGSLGAWLSRILINTFISRHRHAKVVATTAARCDILDHLYDPARLAASKSPERAYSESGFSDEVRAAMDRLPAHYRIVIELVDIQGLAYKEAAAQLEIPLGTVMSRLHRARRMLREPLSSYAAELGLN
ncbi:MAG: sigma-70 family RNA polymerase sigma factor [Myxococcota bacterium]